MAKINPIKTRQDAEKAEKAGKLEQAIPLYRLLLEENPRDWNTINKIGDLFAKIGKMREAGDEFAKVAEFYAKDGFHLKAIAIWKKINKLDPTDMAPYAQLADLYARQGLLIEAKGQYQILSEDQLKRGRLREAAETLRKMVELDSSDLKTRSRLAELYTREGSTAKAVAEYVAISNELNLKGHPAEAIQVLEKGLKIDNGVAVKGQLGRVHLAQRNFDAAIAYLEEVTAQDPSLDGLLQLGQAYLGAKRINEAQTTLESVLAKSAQSQEARVLLAQIYSAQGKFDESYDAIIPLVEELLLKRDTERASNLLTQITNRAPHHVRTLQKLVEVARIRMNDRVIVQALNNLLEAHLAAGSDRAAEDTAAQLVEVEPDNEQFKARLESLRRKKAAPVVAGPARVAGAKVASPDMTLPPPTTSTGTSDFDGLDFDTGAIIRPKGVSADSKADREFIEEHLAESRVFRKYGLLDKAEEQVDLVLVRYPNIFDGRFEKKEIFKETERLNEAAKECLWLAGVARNDGNTSLADMLSNEAEVLWPGISEAEVQAPEPPVDESPFPPSAELSVDDAFDQTPPSALDSLTDTAPEPGAPDSIGFEAFAAEPPAPESAQSEAALFESTEPEAVGFEAFGTEPAGSESTGPESALFESGGLESMGFEPTESEPMGLDPTGPESTGPEAALPGPALEDEEEELDLDVGGVEDQASNLPDFGTPAETLGLAQSFGLEAPSQLAESPGLEESFGLEEPSGLAGSSDLEESPGFEDLAAASAAAAAGFGEELGELEPPAAEAPSLEEPPEDHGPDLDFASGQIGRPTARHAPAVDPEVSRALEEVDSYMALGFVDDAKDALGEALKRFPGDPSLTERASSLGLDVLSRAEPAAAPPPPPKAAPPPASTEVSPPAQARSTEDDLLGGFSFDDLPEAPEEPAETAAAINMRVAEAAPVPESAGIDLGAELSALFDAQPALEEVPSDASRSSSFEDQGLQDVFDAFKKGVDSQLAESDYDTRYNLGIAYKEMGLIDEAIAEFQLAAKDVKRSLECSSMIGICFMEKGMADVAAQWYQRGLQVPGRAAEEYRGLRYDLGMAFEAMGDLTKATSTFGELVREDPSFRDASSKLRELQSRA